jgi:hypothetical protein
MTFTWPKITLILTAFLLPSSAFAQLERVLSNPDRPVDDIFKAPKIIGLNSVKQIGKNHLHMSILHTFNGSVSGGIDTFFGIDNGANVRLGLDYGISDDLSVGLGRTSNLKVVDTRVKWTPINQTTQSSPVSVAFLGAVSIETIPNRFTVDPQLSDKMGYFAMAMVARKFSDKLSLQASPMLAYFERPILLPEKALVGLGIAGRYKLAGRSAITFETIPILNKPDVLSLPVAIGWDLETGGHVFQMFFTTSTFHTENYIMAYNLDPFWDKKPLFRFGFNVNRVFAL